MALKLCVCDPLEGVFQNSAVVDKKVKSSPLQISCNCSIVNIFYFCYKFVEVLAITLTHTCTYTHTQR